MYVLSSPHQDPAKLKESVEDILDQTKLLSMATASKDAEPWVNTAAFGYDDSLRLYIVTYPDSKHMRNLRENNQLALTIFDSGQEGRERQGLQLAGMCSPVPDGDQENAMRIWGARVMGADRIERLLKDFMSWESKPYMIMIDYVKVFDEKRFGVETWVTCQVERSVQ